MQNDFCAISHRRKKVTFRPMNRPSEGVFETRVYYTWMGQDGVARTQVKPGAEVVLEDARENSRIVNSLNGPERFPLLIDTRQIKSISKEARDHFSLRGRSSRVNGFAILIDSPLSKIIGNFFMGLNKPRVPARLFTSEEQAAAWCRKFLDSTT